MKQNENEGIINMKDIIVQNIMHLQCICKPKFLGWNADVLV